MVKLRPSQLGNHHHQRKTRSLLSLSNPKWQSAERPTISRLAKASYTEAAASLPEAPVDKSCLADHDHDNYQHHDQACENGEFAESDIINTESLVIAPQEKSLHGSRPSSRVGNDVEEISTGMTSMRIDSDVFDTLKEICCREENQFAVNQAAIAFTEWKNEHIQVNHRHEMSLVEGTCNEISAEPSFGEKDIEIKILKERLQIMEHDKFSQLGKLQTTITSLQDENARYSQEIKRLQDQLAGKDEEILLQTQRINNLLPELEELRKKTAKYTKDNIHFQSESNTNSFQFSLEDLGMTLQSGSIGHAKPSEAVSIELQEHLQRLTSYVRELEMCLHNKRYNDGGSPVGKQEGTVNECDIALPIDPVMVCFKSSNQVHVTDSVEKFQNRNRSKAAKNSCSYLHNEYESEMIRENQSPIPIVESPYLSENKKVVSWNQGSTQEKTNTALTSRKFFSKCISWKWRWAAAALQLQALSKDLQNKEVLNRNKMSSTPIPAGTIVVSNNNKLVSSMQKLGFIHVQNLHNSHSPNRAQSAPSKLKQKETRFSVPGHRIGSIVLSIWRASTKNEKLEKEASTKSQKLKRLLSAFPWLIQRFKERRQMERIFLYWAIHMLKTRMQSCNSSNHRKTFGSLSTTPPALSDFRVVDGNGYQGRYMRYAHTKPIERPLVSEAKKGYSKSPSQHYPEQKTDSDAGTESPSELLLSNIRDSTQSINHINHIKNSPTSDPYPINTTPFNLSSITFDSVNDTTWTKRTSITSFAEKTMQELQAHESRSFASRDRKAISLI